MRTMATRNLWLVWALPDRLCTQCVHAHLGTYSASAYATYPLWSPVPVECTGVPTYLL